MSASKPEVPARLPDPRGVRVSLVGAAAGLGIDPIVVEPPPAPILPGSHIAGRGVFGGMASSEPTSAEPSSSQGAASGGAVSARRPSAAAAVAATQPLVDGRPTPASVRWLDPSHVVLAEPGGSPGAPPELTRIGVDAASPRPTRAPGGADAAGPTSAVAEPPRPTSTGLEPGRSRVEPDRREVLVDGWRIEVEVESASRAALRERARRGREEAGHSGPTEVHAIIPGVVVSVSVQPGDQVVAGQQLLAVEAMKMQNELRAPRDGTIDRVAVAPGRTIEVGDLLLVIG